MACETWCKRTTLAAAAVACAGWLSLVPVAAQAGGASEPAATQPADQGQPGAAHATTEAGQPTPADAHGAASADDHAATQGHGSADAHAGESPWSFIGKVFNFLVLVGTLVYFLRTPFAQHLADRGQQVRNDLVTARSMKDDAARQIATIDARLKQLPAELEALRAKGQEEVLTEEARIREAAAAERDRLLEQTRREIDLQLRIARRDLVGHAADLAVQVARERIRARITDADQLRLVDRYLAQVGTHG